MADNRTTQLDETQIAEFARLDAGPRELCGVLILHGTGFGRFYSIDRPLIIGRAVTSDIPVDDDDASRRHARLVPLGSGQARLEDLQSTNGTFVNGERVTSRDLQDGDKIRIGSKTVLKFNLHDSTESTFHQRLYESATRDALTQCLNKRVFDTHLPMELAFCGRTGRSLTLALLDLDKFKSINDTHGHLAGDAALRTVAETLHRQLRQHDVLVRYGGDEFALLMREIAQDNAELVLERLRAAVEASPAAHEGAQIITTVTVGVAVLVPGRQVDGSALITAADEALFEAKRAGRNRVRLRTL